MSEWEEQQNRELTPMLLPQMATLSSECIKIIAGLQDYIPYRPGPPARWALNLQQMDLLSLECQTLVEAASKEYKRSLFTTVLRRLTIAHDKCQTLIELIDEVPFAKNRSGGAGGQMPEAFVDFINNME